jgi:hypothetical protein
LAVTRDFGKGYEQAEQRKRRVNPAMTRSQYWHYDFIETRIG